MYQCEIVVNSELASSYAVSYLLHIIGRQFPVQTTEVNAANPNVSSHVLHVIKELCENS